MFTEQEKIEFKPYVKKKFDNELSINDAMIAAYLDVCRGPLNGINECIKNYNSNYTSTKVRKKFIKEVFISRVNDLANVEKDYDLHCQKAIRDSLTISPLNWEFIEWKKEKDKRDNKN